ncbi:Gmad2 immunoglobulin-like domain-containing protein [Luteirhabdus pelagi]|uniref:Gmad2 immunoglobulin-like domain-containing protein n=1 Tax=Luteirhabdus pelagi TaxID=2792783 RepID=UPI00193AA12D|nr:Gmad2 immunoglobulin-like domain-containing protein [Luteirhabdus pelagi]
MLNFDTPPKGWGEYGGIFIHLPISNFEANCFTASGEEKPMKQCDPMGDDSVKLKGSVSEENWNTMLRMLETLEFYEGEREERPISELVQITKPLPNTEITSPLTIEGKARGFWYFEGDFPLRLVNKDDAILYEGPVSANGKWMTEDFVPFPTTITFKAPDDERGYLVFERDNPSGTPENDRSYRLPVLFPPK